MPPEQPRAWALAPKHDVAANKLVRNDSDQLGKVFVGFGLAFNDLKGLVLFEQYLLAMGRPERDDWAERAGQWRGCAVQLHRWIAGVLHEVMVLIQKNRHLLRGAEMQLVVNRLAPATRASWESLTSAALDTSGNGATLLNRIRNNAAFHYGANDLGIGYKRQFVEHARDIPHVANLTAQYSFGPDMDGTRFYFSDAAVQQRMMMLGLQFGAPETDKTLVELAAAVNMTLAPLIKAFIDSRTAG